MRTISALAMLLATGCGSSAPIPRTAAPVIEADSGSARAAPPERETVGREEPPEEPAPVAEPEEALAGIDAPIELAPGVVARVREVVARVPRRRADVFAKIGDSATVSRVFMQCFADDDELDLSGREELRPHIEAIRRARIGGRSSFSRESQAARVGWSVHHMLRGSPSPVVRELRAMSPRFALVMFGGNDIEIGRLDLYGTRMTRLVDALLERGTIPILSTIPPRDDDGAADAEVPRYNALIHAIAAARRVPMIDLHAAMEVLPRHGLTRDGVHPNAPIVDGRARGCDFSESGLRHGMNVRNLMSVRMLAHLRSLIADPVEAPAYEETAVTRLDGERVAVLGDTRDGTTDLDGYAACDATQSEAGPERRYSLHLDAEAVIRAEVMYESGVDVDVHLLREGRCIARGDRRLEARVEPGDYEIVVDTFESERNAGEYLLLVER